MAVGGARAGAGRKQGTLAKVTNKAREAAMETGLLPHEWLLKVSRGEPITHRRWKIVYFKTGPKAGEEKSRTLIEEEIYADFPTRLDAAKAASGFYAPKLAVKVVNPEGDVASVAAQLAALAEKLPG